MDIVDIAWTLHIWKWITLILGFCLCCPLRAKFQKKCSLQEVSLFICKCQKCFLLPWSSKQSQLIVQVVSMNGRSNRSNWNYSGPFCKFWDILGAEYQNLGAFPGWTLIILGLQKKSGWGGGAVPVNSEMSGHLTLLMN